jgi:hypothetical protein
MTQRAGRAVEFLLARGTLPVLYWLKKDVLAVPVEREGRNLEKYADRIRLLDSQGPDGSWTGRKPSDPASCEQENRLFETIRNGFKLYDFGCSPEHDSLRRAAEFIFLTQNREGGFQSPEGQEPSPITQALALELLCRSGWGADGRVQKGFRWLLNKQQKDGGWAIIKGKGNGRTAGNNGRRTLPSSDRVTGVVLRALAESPLLSRSRDAQRAGECLLCRFFQDSSISLGRAPSAWEEISFPFWAAGLLSGLDSLARIGFKPDRDRIKLALDWIVRRQSSAGYWESRGDKANGEDSLWVTLAVLRMLKHFEVLP